MTHFAVTAARFDGDKLTALKMGELEPGDNFPAWRSPPAEVLPHEVVDRLMGGDTVTTIYQIDGHRVAGPTLRRLELADGVETVQLASPGLEGRTLRDLPTF